MVRWAASAVGGAVLIAFRLLGRHLAAPVMAHIATNSLGYALAWWYLRVS